MEKVPAESHSSEGSTTFQKASFLLYLLAVTAAFLFLLKSFLMPLLLASVFAGLTYPIYRWILSKVRRPVIAALLTIIALLLVLVVPLIAVGAVAYQEAVGFFNSLDLNSWRSQLESVIQGLRDRFPSLLQRVNTQNITGMAISGLQNAFQLILKHSAGISLTLANNLLSFFLMLFIMFYFYLDGPRILERVIKWSPLKDEYERILIAKFVSVSKGTLKGILMIGIIQGILGALLFWSVGLSSPVFLGVLMVFASIVPALGTAAIWAPAAIVLLIDGRWGAALVVFLCGAIVIGSVDNFVRPILVGKDIKMHDLLVLLSTLGGLGMFGLSGFIIGPIIASLFLAIWNIFEEVFADELALNRQKGFQTRKFGRIIGEDVSKEITPSAAATAPAPATAKKPKK